MKNSDVYERIAQAYFGTAPSRKVAEQKNKSLNFPFRVGALILVSFIILVTGAGFYYYKINSFPRIKPTQESLSIMLGNYPLKLKYNFNWPYPDIKKISFDLPKVNLAKFKQIELMLKGSHLRGDLSRNIRIELENSHREKDSQYLLIPNDYWHKFTVDLDAFKGISDWSGVTKLSVIAEKWNIANNEGAIYINDIKFSKHYSD